MDTGLSLFSEGAECVSINTGDQGEEGDDYLEEHNRKREELGAELRDAFDDLSEHSEEDSISSEQSDNDESPCLPQSDYYHQDRTPPSRGPSNRYSYQNGTDGHIKARHLTFNGEHSADSNGNSRRHLIHQDTSNICSPTEQNRERGSYYHPGYSYDSAYIDGKDRSSNDENQYRQADLGSQEQLMIMYRARVLDVKRLTDAIESLRREKDSEIDDLERRVLTMEAEKQSAVLSQKESHHLNANREVQINALQRELDELKSLNVGLEKEKCELSKEVNLLRSSAVDLQQKVLLLEKNGNTIVPSEKQMESFYKAMQQRHEAELRDLQSTIESLMDKLKNKEGECVILEERLRNMTRAYDALQVAKAETVNNLATQIEESQRKMQSLATNSAVHEMTKLRVLLEQTENDKKALEKTLALTMEKLELAEKDLLQYESATRLGIFNSDDSSQDTDSITHLGISRRHSLDGKSDKHDKSRDSTRSKKSSVDQDDLAATLKTEIHRALQGQHSKRAEIRRLQDQLAVKDKKIKSMLEKEQIYVTESKKYEAHLSGILERQKRQQEDLKTAFLNESRLKANCEELQKDLQEAKDMVERLQLAERENASLRERIRVAHEAEKARNLDLENHGEALKRAREEIPSSVEKELTNLRVRLEQSQKECEEMKQLYIQMSAEKRELLTRFEEKDSQLVGELKNIKKERDEFEVQHREAQLIINNLKDERDALQKSLDEALRSISSLRNSNDIKKVMEESERKCRQLQERIAVLEMENKQANDLEAEICRLRQELSDIPNQHQVELERISVELSSSRERVVQLERKLREEFRTQIETMTTEIDYLRNQIDQKNQLLDEYIQTLGRLKTSTKDAAVETVSDEGLLKKTAALALQLEKAEERHRHVVETLRQEFDRRLASQEKEMKTAQERQAVLFAARYKTEIAAIEEQLKEDAAKYFAEEISALQEKHIQDHNAVVRRMRENEAVLAAHIESLKKSLQERIREVEELNKKVGSGSSEDVKQLQQRIDSERDKMAEMLNCWAAEVQDLRNQVTMLSEDLNAVRAKYKEMKKLAVHYKKQVIQVRQDQKEDFQRKEIGYREALHRVKERVKEVVENHGLERRRSLDEKLYENQLLDLAAKQRNLNL